MPSNLNVQFGCGLCTPDGWSNVDSTPALVAALFHHSTGGLPWPSGSVRQLYARHGIEHLARFQQHWF